MYGLCGSNPSGNGFPAIVASSAYEPIAMRWSGFALHSHTGNGVPQ